AARVFVGVTATAPEAPAPPWLDVALCPSTAAGAPAGWVTVADVDAALAGLDAACTATPAAATVLVQVLRTTETLAVGAGVVAESLAYSMLQAGPEFSRWLAARPRRPHRASSDPVLITDDGSTVTITLNRPDVRNAYDAETRDALVDVLRGLAGRPDATAVVLRGAGPAFCSGGDLTEFGTTSDPVAAHAVRVARAPGPLLARVGVTARVHGACVGAGVELPAFCPRVVAAPDATFRLPEVAMGLVPGAGGTASITARVGRHRAAYLALTGTELAARDALEWGLVDAIG
ncbi:MAG TPA: enoyl-CoA hydratase/isomerase family protein, partial [Acidimicrobiales bacterium]|nr:enoyl-CoA hydratase/isomerase family protein [Acidimicrobiales bacterium]